MNMPHDLTGHTNRFDLLRLLAALAVFASHADFLFRLHLVVAFAGHSLGSLAVYVFFFISGYLVAHSWAREPDWVTFGVKRVARIFPGLLVAVLFSVVVVGWSVTTWSSAMYWSAPETWLNLLNNSLGIASVQTLPGVFEANPFARAVNGSLWTIRYELSMYLLLALMAWIARGARWVYVLAVVTLAVLWEIARQGFWDAAIEAQGGALADVFRWRDFCGFGVPFFMGSALAAYGLRPGRWMAVVAAIAAVCAAGLSAPLLVQCSVWILVGFGAFYVALAGRPAVRSTRARVDLSYGIYIYAFPVQQAVTEASLRLGWSFSWCVAVSLIAVLILARMSWHLVELPSIRAGQRWLSAQSAGSRP